MNLFSVYSQQKEFQDIIEGANKEKWRKAMLWEMETFKEEDNTWLEVDDCPEFVGLLFMPVTADEIETLSDFFYASLSR
ncbi:hypothetical protein QE152_g25966 [Popillia japonica]|uniref:Uncharacterized protein n=1 Tax=Popillia japonica TaxID=7064 RepID=A0AAW1JZV1_POPJA